MYNIHPYSYTHTHTHSESWLSMQTFANRSDLLCYLTNNSDETNNSVFKGIRQYIKFSMNKTKVFMEHDQQNKAIFFGWQPDAVFHFLQNFINVMITIPSFRKIVMTDTIQYDTSNYDQKQGYGTVHFKFYTQPIKRGNIHSNSAQLSEASYDKYNNTKPTRPCGWDSNYLICPLPGDLVFTCQRFLVDDNGKRSKNCQNMHMNKFFEWGDVRFYTLNQLCKKFHQSFDGPFKQELT